MYSGLWMYAWDFADEGTDKVMAWAADSGLTALQIAGAYHAGWFIHPHNPKHRAYMPEDGTVYFQPNLGLYQNTILKPKVASVSSKTDWMREVGNRLDKYHLKMVSWTVCNHNTRLGKLHPECTVHNCFGDSYPHALCPANDHVRNYLTALCHDLANNLPMYAVQLESPDYMGLVHGHHHERDLTVLSPLEQSLLSFCFCASCTRKAEGKHVDIGKVKREIHAILEAGMSHAPSRPAGHPTQLSEVMEKLPELAAYMDFRKEIENTLIQDIKTALKPSQTKLYLLGGYNAQIADSVDVFNAGVYGQKPEQALISTQQAKKDLQARHELYVGVRLGLNSVADAQELTQIVQAIQTGGGQGVMFYNYSESPMEALNWIKPALKGVR